MHSMNYHWPYRGVQHPYPPSAPPAQNQVSSSATAGAPAPSALPYPHAQAANASNYTTPTSTYTNSAQGYHAASSTYGTSSTFQTSSQPATGTSYSSATGTQHPNYAPTVSSQRQQGSVDAQVQQPSRPTVTPGTPLSATGSASYSSANNSSYSRNLTATSATTQAQNGGQQARQEEQRNSKNPYPVPPSQISTSAAKAPQAQAASATSGGPKRKSMGRLGDADVHQAFVEFRAKDTDKCLSAQCIYCQSVRAKNTSRQRQHLLECQGYLSYMREQNPNHPILEMAAQHAAGTPLKDIVKTSGTTTSTPINGSVSTPNGHSVPNGTPTQSAKRHKTEHNNGEGVVISSSLGSGFAGSSVAPSHTLPVPKLERDFQLAIQLSPRIDLGKSTWGPKNWTSYVTGHWNGRWGKGAVVPGGQDVQTSTSDGSMQTESRFLLQTHDQPPAYITVKMEGWRVGPRDILERLSDPAQIDSVDPRTYSHRCFISMETGDDRFRDLNTGMWLGTVVRKTTEVVYDAYRIS